MESRYRNDIQGLRALAVLPVIGFHLWPSRISGGFVGVDIFFVISGYLITQLIMGALHRGKFSLAWFYERRLRRIGPALLVLLAVTWSVGWRYCLPEDFADLSKSAIAATLSASNLYFNATAGYFDGPASAKPLLHTWSLAVEEQFYLLWPLLLAALARYHQRWTVPALVLLTMASLALSAWGAFHFPTATFYMPWTRLWELSCGGLLALGIIPTLRSSLIRNIAATAGLALVLGSVMLIGASFPFPGLLAIPPCLGALLVIAAGRDGDSLIGRALSSWPLVAIGAISYSLYLWHWPIWVYQRNYAFLAAGLSPSKAKLLVFVASLAAATASYWIIEKPWRLDRGRLSVRALVRTAGVAAAAMLALGTIVWAGNGLPQRFTAKQLQTILDLEDGNTGQDRIAWRAGSCFLYDDTTDWKLAPQCLEKSDTKKNYLIIGDSHAAELRAGLSTVFGGINFMQATGANCFPTIEHGATESAKCAELMNWMLRAYIPNAHLDRVVISAKWKPSVLENLEATLIWLKNEGVGVTVLGPTPLYDAPVPSLVIEAMKKNDRKLLQRHISDSGEALSEQMGRLTRSAGAEYVPLTHLGCSEEDCAWPQMWDEEHFNIKGSSEIAREIASASPYFASGSSAASAMIDEARP